MSDSRVKRCNRRSISLCTAHFMGIISPYRQRWLIKNYGFYVYTSEYMKDRIFYLRRTICILCFVFIYIFNLCAFFSFS